jgi:Mn-dependent DtxR family transcriptional regulator
MLFEAKVLRAMLRLARRRAAVDVGGVADRAGGSAGDVREALRRLEGWGLVDRAGSRGPRLTMSGFALAVAMLPEAAGRVPARAGKGASRAA